eukprot:3143138-Amphidinium_carterae.1
MTRPQEQASGQVDSSMTSEAVPEWAFSREEEARHPSIAIPSLHGRMSIAKVSPTEEASGSPESVGEVNINAFASFFVQHANNKPPSMASCAAGVAVSDEARAVAAQELAGNPK